MTSPGLPAGYSVRPSVTAEDDPELGRWRFAVVDGARAGICQASGGALRLYESAGMRLWMQIDAFRRRVHADG